MAALTLNADFSLFRQKLNWMAGLLESLEIRERLDSRLMNRFFEALSSSRGDEFTGRCRVPTIGANEVTIVVEFGGILEELAATLGALGFEFHEVPVKS